MTYTQRNHNVILQDIDPDCTYTYRIESSIFSADDF